MTLHPLSIKCPRCGSRPGIRITDRERELHRKEPPDTICKTYRCRCGEVFSIPAEAYQRAS